MERENPFLVEALRLCREGRSVIPLSPRTKMPPAGFPLRTYQQERRASEEEIRRWWQANPNYNIGVCTGKISNLIVVDCDPRNGGVPAKMALLAPTDRIVETGRGDGGIHSWLIYPRDVEIANGEVERGVDVKSDGGYVVCPPSIHPETGKEYFWRADGEIWPASEALIERLPKRKQEEEFSVEASPQPQDEGQRISRILSGVEVGERNNNLIRLAGYLAGKGLPPDITEAVACLWNQNNTKDGKRAPLPLGELKRTVLSAYQMEGRKQKQESTNELRMLGLQEFLDEYSEMQTTWTVAKWLPSETICFVVAAPQSYKTWMTDDLSVSVASGEPFLGIYPVEETGPVSIFQQEDFLGGPGVAGRLNAIMDARLGYNISQAEYLSDGETVYLPRLGGVEIPIFIHPDRALRFTDQKRMDQLEKHLEMVQPKLVVIDPLYSVGPLDDYMQKVSEQMIPLKQMRDRYHCTFLLVHHMGKNNETAWGNVFLTAAMETSWTVSKDPVNQRVISVNRHSKMCEPLPLLKIAWDIDTESANPHYRVEVYGEDEAVPDAQPVAYESTTPLVQTVIDACHSGVSTDEDLARICHRSKESVRAIKDALGMR